MLTCGTTWWWLMWNLYCICFQMEVSGLNSVLVQNLSSLSRYLVSVQSHYPQGLSAALTSNVTTCKSCINKPAKLYAWRHHLKFPWTEWNVSWKWNLSSLQVFLSLPVKVPSPLDLRVTNFSDSDITVRWEAAADDVVSYLIKWISLSGGDLRQVRLIEAMAGEFIHQYNAFKLLNVTCFFILVEGGWWEWRGDPGGGGGR